VSPAAPFLANGIDGVSGLAAGGSDGAEQLRFRLWGRIAREKRSAERAGRRGAWEGTCGVSRMCPDKPPSCYPPPPTIRWQR